MDGGSYTAADAQTTQRERLSRNLEGEQVGRAGHSALANPYELGTVESIGWLEGWAAGRQRASTIDDAAP